MPLPMAKAGETILIKEITGGRRAKARLADMGLRPGDLIEVINNNGFGRLIVGHDCSRLALGRGIAKKILVSLAPPNQKDECKE